mmetsp:Transcript_103889/g.289440  ORF Transcript_103889/g.289440 Transcript_103889/m.289440 type:complete len:111 (-) Transcript_103889:1043-1375(-)
MPGKDLNYLLAGLDAWRAHQARIHDSQSLPENSSFGLEFGSHVRPSSHTPAESDKTPESRRRTSALRSFCCPQWGKDFSHNVHAIVFRFPELQCEAAVLQARSNESGILG